MFCLLLPVALAAEPTTLSLDEALQRVESNNADLAMARARADEARSTAALAMAPLLPALQVQGSYLLNDKEVTLSFSDLLDQIPIPIDTSDFPDDITLQPKDAFQGGAGLKVPLLNIPGFGDLSAARAAADAADATSDATRIGVQSAVVQAAALVSAAEGLADAARHAEQNSAAHLDAARRAVAAGTQPKLAELAAEADLAKRQSDRVGAEADLARAQRALGVLVGVDGPVRVTLPEDAPLEGEGSSPELAVAQATDLAAHRALWAARLRYLPTVSGSLTGAASTSPFVTGDKTTWHASVDLTWTLFDGAARESKIAIAAAKARQADAALSGVRLQSEQKTADASHDLEVAHQRRALAEAGLNLAKEADDAARDGLKAGTVSALDARDAEQRLFEAEVSLVAAKAGEQLSAAALRRARGQGW